MPTMSDGTLAFLYTDAGRLPGDRVTWPARTFLCIAIDGRWYNLKTMVVAHGRVAAVLSEGVVVEVV